MLFTLLFQLLIVIFISLNILFLSWLFPVEQSPSPRIKNKPRKI